MRFLQNNRILRKNGVVYWVTWSYKS